MDNRWERLHTMWQSDKSNLPLTVELVDALIQQSAWSQCEDLLAQLDEKTRNSPEICAKYIDILFHQNRLSEALIEAEALCQLTQNHPIALHYLALSHFLNGNLEGVLALQAQPQLTPETTILIARALYHKGELDQALQKLQGIQLPEAVGLSAMLYLDTNRLNECQQCADLVLSAVDNQMDALLAKASYLVTVQSVADAKPYIDRALRLQPKSGRALSVRGQIEFFDLQLDQAIATFEQAVSYMPDHIGTWHLLAWSYYLVNNLTAAKQAFDKAMDLDHNFGETHGGLAVLAAVEGDITTASTLAKKALRLNPASFAGLYANSLIAEQAGKGEEATQIIDGILARGSHVEGKSNRDLINAVIEQRRKSS